MRRAMHSASEAIREYGDPSPRSRGIGAQDDNKVGARAQDESHTETRAQDGQERSNPQRQRNYAYRSSSRVDRLDEDHPGIRNVVETLLRQRVRQGEIARQVYEQFGVRISTNSLSRFFMARIQPKEDAEAAAFRQAHAQARALIEEMKADPSLDAAQIAEIMLANQIVQDRTKLAEADIMDLYREQRERRKLELQHRALLLKEEQTRAVLEKMKEGRNSRAAQGQTVKKIREIYGLSQPSRAEEAPGPVTASSARSVV